MRNFCFIQSHPEGCNCPVDNRELFESYLELKNEKMRLKMLEERRKSIEWNKLIAYWNKRLEDEGMPVPIDERNQDIKDFRDNGHRFIQMKYKQLTLF